MCDQSWKSCSANWILQSRENWHDNECHDLVSFQLKRAHTGTTSNVYAIAIEPAAWCQIDIQCRSLPMGKLETHCYQEAS